MDDGLRAIVEKLDQIAQKLHKPFEDIYIAKRHKEVLEQQKRQYEASIENLDNRHKETLLQQREQQKEIMDQERKHHQQILLEQDRLHRENMNDQRVFNKQIFNTQLIVIVLTFFMAFAAIASAFAAIRTVNYMKSEAELYETQLVAQITLEKLPWSHFDYIFTHKLSSEASNKNVFKLSVYVEVNNKALAPFQLVNVAYYDTCGNKNSGLLSIPPQLTKVVKSGEAIEFNDKIDLIFQNSIGENLPCDILFTIHGDDIEIQKIIRLVK